jgi:DNA topoisomerase II
MHGFDEGMKLQHFVRPEDIIDAYIPVRQAGYVKRKEVQLEVLLAQNKMMTNKARFINALIAGEIPMVGGEGGSFTNQELVEYLRAEGYAGKEDILGPQGEGDSSSSPSRSSGDDFSYLLDMSIASLTLDRANSLNARVLELEIELDVLNKTSPEAMWLSDLAKLETELMKDDSYTR